MKRILLIVVFFLALVGALAFWFVSVQGRGLVVAELERITGKKVTLGAVQYVPPAALALKDLRIEGLARIPRAVVIPHVGALLGGRLEIASLELQSPEINISLPSAGLADAVAEGSGEAISAGQTLDVKPVAKAAGLADPEQATVAAVSVQRAVSIDLVRVSDGTVMVQAPVTGKTWILEEVRGDLWHFAFFGAVPVKTEFVLECSLAKLNVPFVGHLGRAKGWVNWAARDMDAKVEALDGEGRVGLFAVLTSRANDCEVKGRALLSSRQTAQATAKKSKMIEATVLDLLGSLKTDIAAGFSFRTLLDRFEIGKVSITGNITTGLQSEEISGNIVGSLKAAGAKLLEKDKAATVKPLK
ncbi:MAG: hypothetical protein HQL20_03405 [Candidatus Omnitrophica bacterium]|nr:hypothetical protein [Candidatus Omnitrophota bacterium]